jgi:hypothetical protein
MEIISPENFFDTIDGVADPLPLFHADNCNIPDAERLRIHPGKIEKIIAKIGEELKMGEYYLGRPLTGRGRTYESNLNLCKGQFRDIVEMHCADTKKSAISVLDSGCGDAVAFEEILNIPCIDVGKSVGLTIHSKNFMPVDVQSRVLKQNCVTIAPKTDRRFDLVLSVLGTATYHPFDEKAGILQSINSTAIGGILMIRISDYPGVDDADKKTTAIFRDLGIIEPCYTPYVYRLVRHPTLEEIKKILGTKNQRSIFFEG